MSKDLASIDNPDSGKGQFLVYEAEDGQVKINVRLEGERAWLMQKLMADLFQVRVPTINEHTPNINGPSSSASGSMSLGGVRNRLDTGRYSLYLNSLRF